MRGLRGALLILFSTNGELLTPRYFLSQYRLCCGIPAFPHLAWGTISTGTVFQELDKKREEIKASRETTPVEA